MLLGKSDPLESTRGSSIACAEARAVLSVYIENILAVLIGCDSVEGKYEAYRLKRSKRAGTCSLLAERFDKPVSVTVSRYSTDQNE